MEGMKTLDIRSYRETIKAAVAHERQADPNWSWGIRSITKGVAHGLPPSLPSGFFPLEKRRP